MPEPNLTISGAFLKLTSWRRPFLGFVLAWLLGGIIGIIAATTEVHDARLRLLLLALLVVVIILVLYVLSVVVVRSARSMRYCQDCIGKVDASRWSRSEEQGPHKIAIEKKEE